jgi:hypothetical protein
MGCFHGVSPGIPKLPSEMPRFRKVALSMGKYLIGAATADNATSEIAMR